MPLSLARAILLAGGALAALPGLALAQTSTAPAQSNCPKGYDSLCGALSGRPAEGGGGLGSQAGTGAKSTVIVHPEALEKPKKPE